MFRKTDGYGEGDRKQKINKPPRTNGPRTKNDSDKTQDICMPYVGNGYV